MCGPMAAAVAITAVSAVSSAQQAKAQGEAQQNAAERNALISERQSADALQRGAVEAGQVRQRTRQQIGQQTTALAGSGVDVSRGSAADITADTAALGSMDEQTARTNAMREAYGYQTQAQSQRVQGQYARQAGRNQATSSILGGATRSFNLYSQA